MSNVNNSSKAGPTGKQTLIEDDTEFRGVQQSADATLDIQMRRQMELLSGTWTGTWTYTSSDGVVHRDQIPQIELTQNGTQLSGGFPMPQVGNGFDGTIMYWHFVDAVWIALYLTLYLL